MYRAAAPATWGVAIEVPVMTMDAVSEVKLALRTSTPGACTATHGPLQWQVSLGLVRAVVCTATHGPLQWQASMAGPRVLHWPRVTPASAFRVCDGCSVHSHTWSPAVASLNGCPQGVAPAGVLNIFQGCSVLH